MAKIEKADDHHGEARKKWTKPELVDVDTGADAIESAVGPNLDGGDNFSS